MKRFSARGAAIALLSAAILLWIAVIYANSMQTGESSGNLSTSVTDAVNSILAMISPTLRVSNLFVRKMAHFLEFAGLAALVSAWISVAFVGRIEKSTATSRIAIVLLAIPAVAAVAAGDESIQLFVDGRVGAVTDVLIDVSGACCAALIFFSVLLLIRRRR